MNYATGCALNGNELMESLDIKRIKTHWTKCKEISGRPSKTSFAVTIFAKALQLAMEDVIDNSVTFELPKGTNNANIYIKEYSGDDFMNGRKGGKWKDIDYLATNFCGYSPMFRFRRAGYTVEKPIYLDSKHKQRIADRANSGKSYY